MKYTMLGFSQQIAADYGLDLNDLAILRWFVDFKESGNMRSMEIDGDVYYWVFYEKISEELFIIKLQISAIYKRLKKMCDCNILKKKTVSCGGNYSYFALGENYQELIKSQKYIKTKSPKKNNTSPDENTKSSNDSLVDLDHDYNINAPFESSSNEDSTQNAIFENTITKVLDHTSYDDNLGAHYNNLNLHDKNLGPLDINLNPQDENLSAHDLCLEQTITPSHSLIKTINHTQEESGEFLLSKLLWHFVKGANPSFSEPDFDLWVRDFGKILHHDHRDFIEVSELISWIFESKSFWTCHVLTPSALRKFYERVLARKNYETNRKKGASKSFFEELESQGFEPM